MVNWNPLGTIWYPFEGAGMISVFMWFVFIQACFCSWVEKKQHNKIRKNKKKSRVEYRTCPRWWLLWYAKWPGSHACFFQCTVSVFFLGSGIHPVEISTCLCWEEWDTFAQQNPLQVFSKRQGSAAFSKSNRIFRLRARLQRRIKKTTMIFPFQ